MDATLARITQRRAAAADIDLYRNDPDAYTEKRDRDSNSGTPETFEVAAARTLSGEDPDALSDLDADRTGAGLGNPNLPFSRDEAATLQRACAETGVGVDTTGVAGLLPSTAIQSFPERSDVEKVVEQVQGDHREGKCSTGDAVDLIMREVVVDEADEHHLENDLHRCFNEPESDEQRASRLGQDPHSPSPTSPLNAVIRHTHMLNNHGQAEGYTAAHNPDGSPKSLVGDMTVAPSDGLAQAEREPGWGKVKADHSALYRRHPTKDTWQRRPRNERGHAAESGEWTDVAAPGPRAVNIAPSVAAKAMGGHCIACGKAINNATSHGGLGPECAKKYS